MTTPRDRERDTMRGDAIAWRGTETYAWLAERVATTAEQTRRARLARWQQGTGNERDEQRRARQTAAVRAQDARSASDPHNSSAA